MNRKAKRSIFIILEVVGIVWNFLCMKNIVPLKYYSASIIGFVLTIMFMTRRGENSRRLNESPKSETATAGISFVLGFAWFLTIIACIIY